ncbi:DMT family transporter [Halorubrum ezzemoulense]|uniref:DMT family transporter n=1 Tax=Halorubrum ezzemoulense TaxID=337243 RepID=UPI00232DD372|nr:DMT family transporter [Halorubrum ezzemoulense]MDB2260922.1 DMT family transporter [Halorubrum ezzemoulense]MDB2268953.1 DMT family transporter [Halorubrum ezzemoulense]
MFTRRTGALLSVSALLFGGTFVAAKAGLAHLPPLFFVAVRFDIGAVVLAAFAATRLSRAELRPRTVGDVAGIVATGVLVIGLTNALLFVGQQYVTSGVAAVVFSLNPILTPAFAAVLLGEDGLSVRGFVGMGLGLFGVALVADPDPSALLAGGLGVPLLFAAAVTSALGAVLIRRADATLSSTARTVWGVPLAAALSHALSIGAGESVSGLSVPPVAIAALLYVGVFSGAIAYLAYFALIDETDATRANLLFYFVPVVSAVGGWALLGETLSVRSLVGFGVIFAGFLLVSGLSAGPSRLLRQLVPARFVDDGPL